MKITPALLLFITALVRADVALEIAQPEPDNSPGEEVIELPAGLILKGDGRVLADDREEALSLWAQAYSHNGAGHQQNSMP